MWSLANRIIPFPALVTQRSVGRTLTALPRELDAIGHIEWELLCIDGSNVRARKAAAGGGKNLPMHEPCDRALGRSRGGWGTKLHAATDGCGLPLAVKLRVCLIGVGICWPRARAVATRFEKLAIHYLGSLKLTMIRCHLRLTLSNTP